MGAADAKRSAASGEEYEWWSASSRRRFSTRNLQYYGVMLSRGNRSDMSLGLQVSLVFSWGMDKAIGNRLGHATGEVQKKWGYVVNAQSYACIWMRSPMHASGNVSHPSHKHRMQ